MRALRVLLLLVPLTVTTASAAPAEEDWALFGRVLALLQPIVRAAAASPDPQAAQREVESMLQGRNAQANRLAADLFALICEDMPADQRATMSALGSDLLTLAARPQPQATNARAVQARKDLHAMGLRYYDEGQFREAQQRGDTIAVDLFIAAGGLRNPATPR